MIIAVVSDLVFRSKIREGITNSPVRFVKSIERLKEELSADEDNEVIVDIHVTGVDPIEAITCALSSGKSSKVTAFGSHVETELLQKAKDAGAHEVLPRSKFVHSLVTRNGERGASIWTVLVFGFIVYAACYYAYHVIPIFYDFYELENQMQAIIKVADTEKDDVIRKRLQKTIKELGIPADPDALIVNRRDGYMDISLKYREIFYFSFRDKDYVLQTFDLEAKGSGNY